MMRRHVENPKNGSSKQQNVELVLNDSEDDELDLEQDYCKSDTEMESDNHLSLDIKKVKTKVW